MFFRKGNRVAYRRTVIVSGVVKNHNYQNHTSLSPQVPYGYKPTGRTLYIGCIMSSYTFLGLARGTVNADGINSVVTNYEHSGSAEYIYYAEWETEDPFPEDDRV